MNKQHERAHVEAIQPPKQGRVYVYRRDLKEMRTAKGERRPEKISGFREDRKRSGEFLEMQSGNVNLISASAWRRGQIQVISALEMAELPGGVGKPGAQWHVSMAAVLSSGMRRAFDPEVKQTLACFGMTGAEEDNHENGYSRHFWLTVDPLYRGLCECKANEIQVIEADGHRWSAIVDPAECVECEIAVKLGRPCTVHIGDSLATDIQAAIDKGVKIVDRRSPSPYSSGGVR